jgi:phosphatidylinositol alpha-1,6-mannosyltransferase
MTRNVLFIVWNWNSSGGLQIVTTQVAEAFRALGWGVTVWSVFDEEPVSLGGIRSEPLAVRGAIAGLVHRRWGWRTKVQERMASGGFDLIVIGHINLLRLNSEGTPPGWPPVVVWAHGNDSWGPMGGRFKEQLESVDRVIAVSGFTRDQVLAHSPAARVEVIPNPVDTEFFTPLTDNAAVRRDEVMICGRMSGMERYKGHETLFEALPIASDLLGRPVKLRVVGGGDDRARLELAALDMGLGSQVTFTGRLAMEELREAYRRCGVFALPSRVIQRPIGHWGGEGFGVVLLEAAACGRPVIASTEGGSPDALVAGETGLLTDPTSAQALGEAIADVLASPARADAMGNAGRRLMESRFSIPNFRKAIRTVADSLVPEKE